MEFVQPIRSVKKLLEMKTVLRSRSERDWFLMVMGINVGLRISDLLQLLVKDVRNKSHIIIQAYRILNRAAAEVGLAEIGTHRLRKTFGYHFYKRYKDVALLQQIFNHSAPSITMRYIGINQDIIDQAIIGFHL
ncbi:tyrosine-type recombinase/integrase [Paenibacillus sp. FSL P4-0288]|uniref:tyrosine-type recombinase/integrase n=1 Tax=Paenibacillus sp. FSL P4-0288 TaxID=2921633 RepID=UPI0030FC7198